MRGFKLINFCLSIFFVIISVSQLLAQTGINSPYSAFGLGYLSDINNVRNQSMGGIGIGTRDFFSINLKNPASYTAFDSTSFVFEAGLSGHSTKLKTEDQTESISSANISHLLFGFPVTKWWRSSFGLVPFSGVGYDVANIEYKDNIGNIQYDFEGDGGISRIFWGNAFKPYNFLSVGVNASYLFGTVNKTQNISFPDSAYYISTNVTNSVTVNDFHFDFGVQYHGEINNNLDLVIGGTFHPQIEVGAKKNHLTRSYYGELNSIKNFKDTISYNEDEKGTVVIPMGYGAGFSLSKSNKWLVGMDYKFTNWSEYKSFGNSDSLENSHSFSIGGNILPNYNSTSYFKRIEYRFGAYYNLSYLKLRNEHLDGYGITFGAGLPIKRVSVRGAFSMINLGVDIGKRGTINNGLIQENYVRVFLSISLYEWWFFKRRYN